MQTYDPDLLSADEAKAAAKAMADFAADIPFEQSPPDWGADYAWWSIFEAGWKAVWKMRQPQ